MDERFTIGHIVDEKKKFKYGSYCRCAVDVTFQQANRPGGSLEQAKPHYSGKHQLYSLKIDRSMLPKGMAVLGSRYYPCSISDKDIMSPEQNIHRSLLRKKGHEEAIMDYGIYREEYDHSWDIL